MNYKDYYSVVGVPKTASQDEIKRAYRKKAAQLHPDKNPGDKQAEQGFKDLQEAYEVLKDPEKRNLYDKVGANWKQYQQSGGDPNAYNWQQWGGGSPFGQSQGGGSSFSDFFDILFGNRGGVGGFSSGFQDGFQQTNHRRAARETPAPVETVFEVHLDDIVHGAEKTVTVNGQQIKVKIPKGIEDGKKLKLKGRGVNGGDLFLVIKTNLRNHLERNGAHLVQTVLLSVWDALLGTTITVKTIKGDVNVKIPELSKPDSSLRLKGFGLPHYHKPTEMGDLYVKIKYALPESLSEKEKLLLNELRN